MRKDVSIMDSVVWHHVLSSMFTIIASQGVAWLSLPLMPANLAGMVKHGAIVVTFGSLTVCIFGAAGVMIRTLAQLINESREHRTPATVDPPSVMDRMFWFVPERDRAILGDMEEEYLQKCLLDGPAKAKSWLRYQAITSLWALVIRAVRNVGGILIAARKK